ncbi:cytochrome P450 [Nonomuraea sp. NPDC050547]|uniref:cytochrome P450 n=1 Tax=Nonomuraea sp. NPDC050547 TaxID=3364368 RepID=UPI00378D242B
MTYTLASLIAPDPYPLYRELRKHAPVHLTPEGIWLISRYADVRALLLDPRATSNPAARPNYRDWAERHLDGVDGPVARWQRSMFVFMDDPEHRRLRQLFQQAFTPASVQALRPGLEAHASELMKAAGNSLEVVSEFALPLTTALIGELLGVPEQDRVACVRRAEITGRTLAPVVPPAVLAAAAQSLAESTGYFLDLVERRRREPRDDLLTALTAVMTPQEVVSSALLLFNAGHETTTALIANAVHVLLGHPGQLGLLRARPSLVAGAVEEVLRFEPSFQFGLKVTREPIELDGVTIPAGAAVVLLGAAANRDPAEFPDPDRFLITRGEGRHLAFGMGTHHCLGAPLARMEAQVALGALLAAWPSFEAGPDEPVRAAPAGALRTLERLPIRRC